MKLLYAFKERANIYRARMAYLIIIRQQTSCVWLLKIKTHAPPRPHHNFSHCGGKGNRATSGSDQGMVVTPFEQVNT
jgi:hypothetical protein